MSVIIDASVALKWVLDEPGSEAAFALRDQALAAPALWLVEAANGLWRRSLQGEITEDEALERLSELMNAPVRPLPIEADLISALRLAATLGHPVYDCLCIAAAIREDTHVVTSDRRLYERTRESAQAERVRLLA